MANMPVEGVAENPKRGVYLLPAATQFETAGSRHRVEPLAAVAREGDRAAVRVQARSHHHVPVREEARLRRPAGRQEGRQAEHRVVKAKGATTTVDVEDILARDQPRHLDHRLHRPVARAAEAAHEEHAHLRREDAARQGGGRPGRRRLLRPALAVLRHAGAEASGLAQPVRHVQARHGRRRQFPRQLRRREGRRQPARRGRLALRRAPTSPPAIPSSTTCC